jgi:branched-chain amino acid transport system permease protein
MITGPLLLLGVTVPTGHELASALVTGLLLGGLFAVTALGLSLVFGVMRLINLVHGELVILGAYLAFELSTRASVDPLISLLVVVPAVMLLGYPLQRGLLTPVMRKGAEPALLTTFGLSIIAQNVFLLIFSGDTRSLNAPYATSSITLVGIQVPTMYLISFAFAMFMCGGAHLVLRRTAAGRAVRASAEDAEAAGVMGIDIRRVYAAIYAVAAGCAAIGGVLAGLTFSFDPSSGITYLLTGFAVVVLGGLGSVKGTFYGGLLLGLTESVGAAFFGDGYRDFIGFVAFLVILSVRPQGLFGQARAA